MKRVICLSTAAVLLAGCASSRASQPSAEYCDGLRLVNGVVRGWPVSVTDRQAKLALAKVHPLLAGAAANDFGGKTQLDVTAFSDDVGRLRLAIHSGVGVDVAMATIASAIPGLPACPQSPSP